MILISVMISQGLGKYLGHLYFENFLDFFICSDELEVHREEDVFNAVIKWTECKADTW